jgi:hypothetical protein
MSFNSSTINYVHLVSYPSVWLPPKSETVKFFIHGYDKLDSIVTMLNDDWVGTDFAVYYFENFEYSNEEHLDWMLVNKIHCDGIFFNINDLNTLTLAMITQACVFDCSGSPYVDKLIQYSNLKQTTIENFIENVVVTKALKGIKNDC